MGLLFGDVLQEFYVKKKTGVLLAVVDQSVDHMARLYFKEGEILHVSFGAMKGKEFLERLDTYEFGMAVFFPGMNPPSSSSQDLPATSSMIETIKGKGKMIRGIHFSKRETQGQGSAA